MKRATEHLLAGGWDPADADGAVRLDHDHRHRRRFVLRVEGGEEILLDLPQAVGLRDGDGLRLEDGRSLVVRAVAERVLDIHAHDEGPLPRIAWHLGNRHLPVQFLPGRIRIRYDHVVAALVRILGGHGEETDAVFDPEAGAYAAGTGGGHHHPHHPDEDGARRHRDG